MEEKETLLYLFRNWAKISTRYLHTKSVFPCAEFNPTIANGYSLFFCLFVKRPLIVIFLVYKSRLILLYLL